MTSQLNRQLPKSILSKRTRENSIDFGSNTHERYTTDSNSQSPIENQELLQCPQCSKGSLSPVALSTEGELVFVCMGSTSVNVQKFLPPKFGEVSLLSSKSCYDNRSERYKYDHDAYNSASDVASEAALQQDTLAAYTQQEHKVIQPPYSIFAGSIL